MSDLSFDFEGIYLKRYLLQSFPGGTSGKEPVNAGDVIDGFAPWSGRSPEEGHGNPLHYSCLENSHGQRSLEGYSTWNREESAMTEMT